MQNAIKSKDEYCHSKYRHTLTNEQTKIPSVAMFGKLITQKATSALAPHFHRDRFEITYISSGTVIFSIDGTDYKLNGGDMFITLPNQIHSTNSKPFSTSEMYWFQLEADPENLLFLRECFATDLLTRLTLFDHPQIHADQKEIYPLIKSAFDLCVSGENPTLAGQYLTLLLEGNTVTETASILNFDNVSYFSVVFKRFSMYSPTQFLEKEKNAH